MGRLWHVAAGAATATRQYVKLIWLEWHGVAVAIRTCSHQIVQHTAQRRLQLCLGTWKAATMTARRRRPLLSHTLMRWRIAVEARQAKILQRVRSVAAALKADIICGCSELAASLAADMERRFLVRLLVLWRD